MTIQSGTTEWAAGLEASELGKLTLSLIIQSYAGQPFKLEQLEKLARDGISGAELRLGVLSLVRTGVVCAVKKTWGERLYFINGRMFPKLQASLLGPVPWREETEDRVTLDREGRPGIEIDLFRVLVWAGQHGLPLTAKGTIHQKTLNRIGGLILLQPGDLRHMPLHYPHRDVYPANIAIVLDLLLALGLLERNGSLSVSESAADSWLRLDPSSMRLAVYTQLLTRYVPADPNLQHYVYALSTEYIQEGVWYPLEDITSWLQRHHMLADPLAEVQITFMHGWLEMLCGLGFVDLGLGREGETAFRWRNRPRLQEQISTNCTDNTDAGHSAAGLEGRFYVQPDFEILVPCDVPYLPRWELELYAHGVTYDAMSVYKLSRESVALALEHGRNPADIAVFLENWAASGIPDNVRSALGQWEKELGRTSLEQRVLLRCTDAEAAEIINSFSGGQIRFERIGPLHFIVHDQDLKAFCKVLNQLDLTPRKPDLSESTLTYPRFSLDFPAAGDYVFNEVMEKGHDYLGYGSKEPQGWIFSGTALHIYERDVTEMALADLFPGMEEIPQAWCKELRSYHASTAKALIQQALAWRTKIRLGMDGEVIEALPLGLLSGSPWKVELLMLPSAQIRELTCSQWDSLQLLLPRD
ncbi:helicase-associated domain-containing protein [Paenibacillus sp. YPG26]|uniref:helicase-associated domain-containing protein n=1 Tax=Paenibacillus sp. YPG26 TaxID=2878915 RepID=UPI00203A50B5|nr:helicase-associated domain-containing protein [Paenibacillus sp. YPG26]USB34594.1 helicase-associated domain-containing protein [Paenibacillus sp. YPG26]